MYLLLVSFALCLVYLALFFFFPFFFGQEFRRFPVRSFYSVAFIIFFSGIVYFVSLATADTEISNRILHTFGGGFISFVICFFAARDSRVSIRKFQFFILSFLIVTALGVANEILEYFLQNYSMFAFAKTANDTWLDLISNSVGALIAGALCTPFIRLRKEDILKASDTSI